MKVTEGIGSFMLIALVQSQQKEIAKDDKLSFIPYEPMGRKKRNNSKKQKN